VNTQSINYKNNMNTKYVTSLELSNKLKELGEGVKSPF
jgi:hypothetical protein